MSWVFVSERRPHKIDYPISNLIDQQLLFPITRLRLLHFTLRLYRFPCSQSVDRRRGPWCLRLLDRIKTSPGRAAFDHFERLIHEVRVKVLRCFLLVSAVSSIVSGSTFPLPTLPTLQDRTLHALHALACPFHISTMLSRFAQIYHRACHAPSEEFCLLLAVQSTRADCDTYRDVDMSQSDYSEANASLRSRSIMQRPYCLYLSSVTWSTSARASFFNLSCESCSSLPQTIGHPLKFLFLCLLLSTH